MEICIVVSTTIVLQVTRSRGTKPDAKMSMEFPSRRARTLVQEGQTHRYSLTNRNFLTDPHSLYRNSVRSIMKISRIAAVAALSLAKAADLYYEENEGNVDPLSLGISIVINGGLPEQLGQTEVPVSASSNSDFYFQFRDAKLLENTILGCMTTRSVSDYTMLSLLTVKVLA